MKKPNESEAVMGRPRLNPDRALTAAERLKRSESERRARGERRLNTWITPEAAAHFDALREANPELTDNEILSACILHFKRR